MFAGVRFSSVFKGANTYEHRRTSAECAQVGEHLGEQSSRRPRIAATILVSQGDAMDFLSHSGFSFTYEAEGDPYGLAMWHGLTTGGYESTTLGFMLSKITSESCLVDVGAASGIFTLLAGSLGADVIAIEAHPNWFRLLNRNLALNEFTGVIRPVNVAVTGRRRLDSSPRPDGGILHHTVISDEELSGTNLRLSSLASCIEKNLRTGKEIVVKMDIEGAEFAILMDDHEANFLKQSKASLFVSLHPGFPYNKNTSNKLKWLVNAIYSRGRGILDCAKVYKNLDGRGHCRLPNGRPIRRRYEFIALTFFGAHDFIFDFNRD